jgi:GGDEF domain-containing protein
VKAWGDPPVLRRKDRTIRAVIRYPAWDGVESPIDPGPYRPITPEIPDETPGPRAERIRTIGPSEDLVRPARTRRLGRPGELGPDAIRLGTHALLGLGGNIGKKELTDPIIASAYRFARDRGARINVTRLLAAYDRAAVQTGRSSGFPWAFEPGGGPGSPIYARSAEDLVHWRPRDRRRHAIDPAGYARWFVEPIAQVQVLELLAELVQRGDARGDAAAPIRAHLLPLIEADFATHVAADDPWRDLFALWLLGQAPATLDDLWYLATAIAYRYATLARRVGGPVIGTGPFDGEQLVSASAGLGAVLWQLRIYPSLVPELAAFVADSTDADGGWSDPGQPSDVLTTLMAADLMLSIDPSFDPRPTIAWFARAQEPEGWWRALGPEVPWLTGAVVDWLERAAGPVLARFRWPGALKLDLDRRTQLPTYAWFADFVRSVAEMPGLANSEWDIAFIDLAGFGAFNTEHGQARGDNVIGAFGRALGRIPGSRAIRDGGDEFVIVGAPGNDGLYDRLDAFRSDWLMEFEDRFGKMAKPVRPRITVSRTAGSELAAARERLGRRIGELKKVSLDPPDDGVIERV